MQNTHPPTTRHRTAADTTQAVDALLDGLAHPLQAEISAIRSCLLSADPSIQEGVKWNVPSFRTHEYFATFHLREKRGIAIILHLGAKTRTLGANGLSVADPGELLQWLAADRAIVRFSDMQDFLNKREALVELVQEWIRHV